MRHRQSCSLLAALTFLASGVGAQATRPDRQLIARQVDSLVRNYVATGPGASASVEVIRGSDTISFTTGLADIAAKREANPSTIYRIGSLTKQFTAAIIMQLAEQKKLSIDDTLGRFLPASPVLWRGIALRRLLNHTSGIHNYTDVPQWQSTWAEDLSPERIVAFVADMPLDFTPNSKWSYSNTGYVLLGMVIEKVTGHPYSQEVQDRLFKPLKMTHSSYCPTKPASTEFAAGYSVTAGKLEPAPFLSMTHPHAAGALCMTVGDFAIWQRALASGRVVSAESYRAMTTPEPVIPAAGPQVYGFGLGIQNLAGHKAVTHTGGVHGFVTIGALYPDDSVQVIVFSNSASPAFGRLTQSVQRAALGLPLGLAVVALPDADRDRFVGTYDLQLPGRVLVWRAFVQNGALVSQAEGQGVIPLRYLGNSHFGADFDPSLRITFVEEAGKVLKIILEQGGGTFPGPRRP